MHLHDQRWPICHVFLHRWRLWFSLQSCCLSATIQSLLYLIWLYFLLGTEKGYSPTHVFQHRAVYCGHSLCYPGALTIWDTSREVQGSAHSYYHSVQLFSRNVCKLRSLTARSHSQALTLSVGAIGKFSN